MEMFVDQYCVLEGLQVLEKPLLENQLPEQWVENSYGYLLVALEMRQKSEVTEGHILERFLGELYRI